MNKIFIFFLLIFFSCNNAGNNEKNKIDSSTLCNILIELHFLSTAKTLGYLNPEDTVNMVATRNKILKKYNINEEELKQSISYFSHKPDSLGALYQKMIERISIKQAQMR